MIALRFIVLAGLLAVALPAAAQILERQAPEQPPADDLPQYPSNPMPLAILQGLDKITARIYTLQAPVNEPVRFGTLTVTVRTCRKRPPEYPPESAAYLEIVEQRPEQAPVQRFHGWMFASSPGLNPLEHPVYDVWLIDCRISSGDASGGKQ